MSSGCWQTQAVTMQTLPKNKRAPIPAGDRGAEDANQSGGMRNYPTTNRRTPPHYCSGCGTHLATKNRTFCRQCWAGVRLYSAARTWLAVRS